MDGCSGVASNLLDLASLLAYDCSTLGGGDQEVETEVVGVATVIS